MSPASKPTAKPTGKPAGSPVRWLLVLAAVAAIGVAVFGVLLLRGPAAGAVDAGAPVVARAVAPTPEPSTPDPAASKPEAAAATGPVSDVLKVQRPKSGEYLGLYLMGKKVGYMFQDLSLAPGTTDRVRARQELFMRAKVGENEIHRSLKETRLYEARPGGRLLSFVVEAKGDGGDQTLEATATPAGFTVIRHRPGLPNQVLQIPQSGEKVEDADQVRVALWRNQKVEGNITDGQDLQTYQVVTTPNGVRERVISGVKVKVRTATTLSSKEKTPVAATVTDSGEFLEIDFGQTLQARAESESVARRLDTVEIFGLTRVVLPAPLTERQLSVPGEVRLVMAGLPEKFRQDTVRQQFRPLGDGQVEVTLKAPMVNREKLRPLPLRDPAGGVNLRSSIIVESDHADIQATARQILGGEQDAFTAARKIVRWVYDNLQKGYGTSSDRATDVLRSRRGDCTEHSLLAVSLLRAAGIPAKRVDGLVYMTTDDGVPAFYWHEWVEAYVGEWVQMDPTFGQDIASPGHFAVGEEGNAEIVPLIGQLKVVAVR